jgi:hypothetical protein
LALRLNYEHPNGFKPFTVTMAPSLGMPLLISFVLRIVLISSFPLHMFLNRMESWNERIALQLRWLG